jgi:magnesium transporter
MAVTVQALRAARPTLGWYARAMRREIGVALLLGGACGLLVGLIVWLWRAAATPAWVIGASIGLIVCAAGFIGLTVPTVLHALRLDPKIAAGPVTLAIADIVTVLVYFNLARLFL